MKNSTIGLIIGSPEWKKLRESMELKSKCCHAYVVTQHSDEGTSYYWCTKCEKACDPDYPETATNNLLVDTSLVTTEAKPTEECKCHCHVDCPGAKRDPRVYCACLLMECSHCKPTEELEKQIEHELCYIDSPEAMSEAFDNGTIHRIIKEIVLHREKQVKKDLVGRMEELVPRDIWNIVKSYIGSIYAEVLEKDVKS